jgi:hypothetical protein
MHIAYVAYTENNVLMLDSDGVCVRVEPLRGRMTLARLTGRRSEPSDGALRCIGAQYVASIDPAEAGGLAHFPRVGTSMLFAAADVDGRIFCVRAGPLTHFESCAGEAGEEVSAAEASPDDTQRQDGLFDDLTDPGFTIAVPDDDMDREPETAPYPSTPFPTTRYARGSQSSRSTPVPPPPPRLPRIQSLPPVSTRRSTVQGSATRLAARPRAQTSQTYQESQESQASQGSFSQSGANRAAVPAVSYAARARPPAPSSHAWLRASPAAALERRFR